MKKISSLLHAAMIASILLISCDKVDDLNTVDFDANFSADLNCNVPASTKSVLNPTFSASAIINPTDDPNVNLYLSNIEGYEIKSVKGTIISLSQENVTIVSADLIIKNFQHTAQWLFQNQLLNVGTVITLANDNGQWNTVGQILKDGQEVTILVTGETDFAGVTFTIKVDIETHATAKVI